MMSKSSKKKKSPYDSLDSPLKKVWYFIWDDDSIWSWLVNIIIAFVVIKFVIYPGLGFVFATSHPVVAVVSGSMEHKTVPPCVQYIGDGNDGICMKRANENYAICDKVFSENQKVNFDFFWDACSDFYRKYNINKLDFNEFPLKNGFNTGDIIVLFGEEPKDINVGDVIVFTANKPDPVIHRVVQKWEDEGTYYYTTKGDHNPTTLWFESGIHEDRVIGKAVFRIPFLGNIKLWFVQLLDILHLNSSVGRLFN